MAIDNIRLPTDVEEGAIGGPRFKTSIQTAFSGIEQRVAEWDVARCEYDIALGIRTKADLLEVVKLYRARLGPAYPFRFKDHSDYEATLSHLGYGDGSTTTFQLVKVYTDTFRSVTRTIQLPVSGSLLVYVGGVLQTETTHYTVNYGTGVVTFLSPPALTSPATAVTATFDFDVPVRFADDELDVAVLCSDDADFLLGQIPSIKLIEVLSE